MFDKHSYYEVLVMFNSGEPARLKFFNENGELDLMKSHIENAMKVGSVYFNSTLSLNCKNVDCVIYNRLPKGEN